MDEEYDSDIEDRDDRDAGCIDTSCRSVCPVMDADDRMKMERRVDGVSVEGRKR